MMCAPEAEQTRQNFEFLKIPIQGFDADVEGDAAAAAAAPVAPADPAAAAAATSADPAAAAFADGNLEVRVGLTKADPLPSFWLAMLRVKKMTEQEHAALSAQDSFVTDLQAGVQMTPLNEIKVLGEVMQLLGQLEAVFTKPHEKEVLAASRACCDTKIDGWCVAFRESLPADSDAWANNVQPIPPEVQQDVVAMYQTFSTLQIGASPLLTKASWVQMATAIFQWLHAIKSPHAMLPTRWSADAVQGHAVADLKGPQYCGVYADKMAFWGQYLTAQFCVAGNFDMEAMTTMQASDTVTPPSFPFSLALFLSPSLSLSPPPHTLSVSLCLSLALSLSLSLSRSLSRVCYPSSL